MTRPYSEQRLGVPRNLYVPGTMNTAGRSVALPDVALPDVALWRRRFAFVGMMPRPELLGGVTGVDLGRLPGRLNRRIVALLDEDHQVGHKFT